MSPESIPQISLGTAALIIFAVCAGFVLLRGMTRMMVGTIVLSLSAWIGFRTWQAAPAMSMDWFGKSIDWFTNGTPLAAFLISFVLLRKIAKAVIQPYGPGPDDLPPRSSAIKTAFLLLLALVPTSLICLIGATILHHNGSIAEVRSYTAQLIGIEESAADGFSRRLKTSIEAAVPESWLSRLDPLTQPARLTLAKIIASQTDSPLKPVIDRKTGKPIPRAIIVEDPALQNLAREGKYGTLLRHPLLTKALADPQVRQLIRELNL